MAKVRATLWRSFKWFRKALVNLVLSPFVALSALVGLLIIAFGQWLRAIEVLLTLVGLDISLGSEFVKGAGVNLLPEFFF